MRQEEKQIFQSIGLRIKDARDEKQMTQKQLADLIDMTGSISVR